MAHGGGGSWRRDDSGDVEEVAKRREGRGYDGPSTDSWIEPDVRDESSILDVLSGGATEDKKGCMGDAERVPACKACNSELLAS